MSSRACRQSLFVGEHDAPDVVGEAAFQATHGLVVGRALCDLAVVVAVSAVGADAYLGQGDGVQGVVELAVAM